MFDRGLSALAAFSMAVIPPAASAQSISLKCEIYWTNTQRVGGYEPNIVEWIDFSVFTLDIAGRQVINEYELAQGDKGTSVRAMVAATPTKVMVCQADKCQADIPGAAGATDYYTLTTFDLASNTLTREHITRSPNLVNGLTMESGRKAQGTCSRV